VGFSSYWVSWEVSFSGVSLLLGVLGGVFLVVFSLSGCPGRCLLVVFLLFLGVLGGVF